MKIISFFFILLSLTMSPLFSQSKSGLAEEYTKLEDHILNPRLSDADRKKNIERNLLSSVRSSLSKKFKDPKKELKELKFEDLQSEKGEIPNSYFIKYKNYYFSYVYPIDPEKYLTSPIEESVLAKPDGLELKDSSHKDEKVGP